MPAETAWSAAPDPVQIAAVPVFVKHLGARPFCTGVFAGYGGHDDYSHTAPLAITDRKGANMAEWPQALRVREWPQ